MSTIKALYKMAGPLLTVPDDEATPEKRTDKIFKEMNKSLNGKLSLEEFIEGSKTFSALNRLLHSYPPIDSR
jgi:Ca2+-binding EF-hand superfamily protein